MAEHKTTQILWCIKAEVKLQNKIKELLSQETIWCSNNVSWNLQKQQQKKISRIRDSVTITDQNKSLEVQDQAAWFELQNHGQNSSNRVDCLRSVSDQTKRSRSSRVLHCLSEWTFCSWDILAVLPGQWHFQVENVKHFQLEQKFYDSKKIRMYWCSNCADPLTAIICQCTIWKCPNKLWNKLNKLKLSAESMLLVVETRLSFSQAGHILEDRQKFGQSISRLTSSGARPAFLHT